MCRKIQFPFFIVAILFFCVSCTKPKSADSGPGAVLQNYVQSVFSVKSSDDRGKLLQLSTGEVKEHLEKMTPAEFSTQFIDQKKEFSSMKIKDEREILKGSRYSIVYEVSYVSGGVESRDRVTNKKSVVLENVDGKWLISEVRNLQTLIEHQNDMTF